MKKTTKKTTTSNAEANKKRLREKMQEMLELHAISIAHRTKGVKKHEKGNVGLKQTPCEVFVFVVIADEQLRNSYQEKFKNTRNFKKIIALESVEKLLHYLEEYQFPKMSIFIAIIDNFFENVSEEEQNQGIAIMKKLQKQDPMMELIMLSEQLDSPNVKTHTAYGLTTYIKKNNPDSFKKILNCMIVAVYDQDKIRRHYDTKQVLKKLSIAAGILIVLMLVIDFVTKGTLIGVLPNTLFLP
ncbi:MAG: hypothetical protein LBR55_07115 [Bacteroidales bacterium]|jgi:DNA-binding NarL/FixJ family response regulator|nr:hypothetical protein [Bacteroidales bacterium]